MTQERSSIVRAISLALSDIRTGGHVFMDSSHEPLPSEQQTAEILVRDFVDPIIADRDRLREANNNLRKAVDVRKSVD